MDKKNISCKLLLAFFAAGKSVISAGQPSGGVINHSYLQQGTYSLKHSDGWSMRSNAASKPKSETLEIGIYNERGFMLNELSNFAAVLVAPLQSGTIALTGQYFGTAAYNETSCSIGYGRSTGRIIRIGGQFNYVNIKQSVYGTQAAFGFSIGSVFYVTEKLTTGCFLQNPLSGFSNSPDNQLLSARYSMGAGYALSDKGLLSVEFNKEESKPVRLIMGLLYQFVPALQLRIGLDTQIGAVCFGVGWRWKNYRMDIVNSIHPTLGITPGISLQVYLKKSTQ